MQQVQNNYLYEKLYNDAAFREKYAKKFQAIYNSKIFAGMEAKPISDQDLSNFLKDKKTLDRYYKSAKSNSELEQKRQIERQIEAKTNKAVQPGLKRTCFFFMKTDGSEESQKQNEEMVNIASNPEYAKDYIFEVFKKIKDIDITEYLKGDRDEITDRYIEKMPEIREAFCIDSMIQNQKLGIPEEISNWYKVNKTYMEALDAVGQEYMLACNPVYALLPDYKNLDMTVYAMAMGEFINEITEAYKEAGDVSKNAFNIGRETGNFMSMVIDAGMFEAKKEQIFKEKEKGNISKDFMSNYVYTKNGKDCSFLDAMGFLADPKEKDSIKIRKLTAEEKANIDKAFEKNSLIVISKQEEIDVKKSSNPIHPVNTIKNIKKYLEDLEDVSDNLNNARGFFRNKSTSYKQMETKLNNYINSIREKLDSYANENNENKIAAGMLKFIESKKEEADQVRDAIGNYQSKKFNEKGKLDKHSKTRIAESGKANYILQVGVQIAYANDKKAKNNNLQNRLKDDLEAGQKNDVSKVNEKNKVKEKDPLHK